MQPAVRRKLLALDDWQGSVVGLGLDLGEIGIEYAGPKDGTAFRGLDLRATVE
jgi:hypothetical protein